jgi:hypothetical protein
MRAEGWTIEPIDSLTPHIERNATASIRLRVTPTRAGLAMYQVETRSAAMVDQFRSSTWVRPAGTPTLERTTASVSADHPWSAQLSTTLDHCTGTPQQCTATYQVARLRVSLPDATAWSDSLDIAARLDQSDPLTALATIATTTALSERLRVPFGQSVNTAQTAHGQLPSDGALIGLGMIQTRERTQSLLARSLTALSALDYGDLTAFAWRPQRARPSSLSVREMTQTIEALALAKRADYPVNAARVNALLDQLNGRLAGRPLPASQRLRVVRAALLAASAFERSQGLYRISNVQPSMVAREARARVNGPVATNVREFADAVRLLATLQQCAHVAPELNAILPEEIQANDGGVPFTEQERVQRAAMELLRWQRALTVEPGTLVTADAIYAVGAAMEALSIVNPVLAQSERRESLQFLRATRDRWEHWFEPEASALALRAMMGPVVQRERDGAALVIRVDGREVKRVVINPNDPWASTLSLRSLELNEWMPQGSGRVEVMYDGTLTADVSLEVERWTATPAVAEGLNVSAPESVSRGAIAPLQIRATIPRDSQRAELWIALPPYVRVEDSALQALVTARTIQGWRYQGTRSEVLVLTALSELSQVQLTVPMRMQRVGRYSVAAVEVRDTRGRLLGTTGPSIVVR